MLKFYSFIRCPAVIISQILAISVISSDRAMSTELTSWVCSSVGAIQQMLAVMNYLRRPILWEIQEHALMSVQYLDDYHIELYGSTVAELYHSVPLE